MNVNNKNIMNLLIEMGLKEDSSMIGKDASTYPWWGKYTPGIYIGDGACINLSELQSSYKDVKAIDKLLVFDDVLAINFAKSL